MKLNYNKLDKVDFDPQQMPRKVKKEYLGRKFNKNKLRKLLAKVEIVKYESSGSNEVRPYSFCPKCGCQTIKYTGNMVEYPERYDKGYCERCGFLVSVSDNSPYMHCLEFKDNDYKIG